MHILPREKHDTNRDYALRNIKANIIDLSLEPGSMVSENELAAELGLSRTPIREALIELSKVGLVEIYPQRGSAIALIDYDMVEEAQFMRNVLEASVAELVCQMIQEEDMKALLDNVMQQEHYLNTGMAEKIILLDNGVTAEELREVILHATFYGGWPTGVNAARVAGEVFAERGV